MKTTNKLPKAFKAKDHTGEGQPSGTVNLPKPNWVSESNRDWKEDFSHENGNYQNECIHCKQIFYGHKRRVICKLCSESGTVRTKEELKTVYPSNEEAQQKFIKLMKQTLGDDFEGLEQAAGDFFNLAAFRAGAVWMYSKMKTMAR